VTRGEIWLAEAGRKRRPVLILTRPEVIDVRELVTVAEITTSIRSLAVEVVLPADAGIAAHSVVNCDGIHTMRQSSLTARVGVVGDETLREVCSAINYALGC